MDPDQPQTKQAPVLKEFERRSQDLIRVYNPTDEDFIEVNDGTNRFVIPSKNKDNGWGKGQRVIPRYVAINYVTHMADKILTAKMDDAIIRENERRIEKGLKTMDKFLGGEELAFADPYKTNNPEKRAEIMKILWMGVVEEYGRDIQPPADEGKPRDTRPMDEQIIGTIDKPAEKVETTAPIVTTDDVIDTP